MRTTLVTVFLSALLCSCGGSKDTAGPKKDLEEKSSKNTSVGSELDEVKVAEATSSELKDKEEAFSSSDEDLKGVEDSGSEAEEQEDEAQGVKESGSDEKLELSPGEEDQALEDVSQERGGKEDDLQVSSPPDAPISDSDLISSEENNSSVELGNDFEEKQSTWSRVKRAFSFIRFTSTISTVPFAVLGVLGTIAFVRDIADDDGDGQRPNLDWLFWFVRKTGGGT